MDGGKEQNYWPGFVDALSNVVLTLVFVLVIFVFALVIASNKLGEQTKDMIEAARQEAAQTKSDDEAVRLKEELENAKQVIRKLQEVVLPSKKEDESGGFIAKGDVTIRKEGDKIIALYPKAVTDLNEKSYETFDKIIEPYLKNLGTKKIVISSIMGLEGFSAGRRFSYYRALGLRTHMLQKYEVRIQAIATKIIESGTEENGRVEIIFQN